MISVDLEPKIVVFSRGDVWLKLFAGESPGVPYTSETKPTNYGVQVQIQFEHEYKSGTFNDVVTLDETPDSNGIIDINISNILHSEFMRSYATPPLPAIGSIAAFITNNIRKYKIRTREIQGIDFEEGSWLDIGSNLKVIFGGVTIDRSTEAWDASALSQAQSVFSWMPSGMMVGVGQPKYITDAGGGSTLVTLYGITNNVLQTASIPDPGAETGECVTYYIGTKLFSDANVANGYKVHILLQSGEERYYYIDHQRKGKLDAIFINGFGAPECVRFFGQLDESLSVDRDKVELIRGQETELSRGDVKQYASRWDDIFRLRTGFISEGEARAMKDLLVYNFFFWIRGSVYEALDITTSDFNINNTGQFLKSMDFEAVRSIKKKIIPIL